MSIYLKRATLISPRISTAKRISFFCWRWGKSLRVRRQWGLFSCAVPCRAVFQPVRMCRVPINGTARHGTGKQSSLAPHPKPWTTFSRGLVRFLRDFFVAFCLNVKLSRWEHFFIFYFLQIIVWIVTKYINWICIIWNNWKKWQRDSTTLVEEEWS